GGRSRSRLRVDQRGEQALSGRAVRRLQAVRYRPRGVPRGAHCVHAGKEHPRESNAAEEELDSAARAAPRARGWRSGRETRKARDIVLRKAFMPSAKGFRAFRKALATFEK